MIRASTRSFIGLIALGAVLTGCDSIRSARSRPLPNGLINQYTAAGRTQVEPRPTGTLAAGSEELWIIAKGAEPGSAHLTEAADARPLPHLRAIAESGAEEDMLPLRRADVHAAVAGPVATVSVHQQYRNPFSHSISVEYVFPLPPNASVSDFIMTIGARHIRGIIRERAEAQRIYAEASRAGHVASLLTQERPNTFTQAVANIDPGKQIDVETTYFHTLAYRDSEYELVLPMLAEPLQDAQQLAPELSLTVDVDAGMGIESIRSLSHAVTVQRPSNDTAHVELQQSDGAPTQDFVLRYKTAGRELKTGLLTHRDQRGGFFILMLQPPDDLSHAPLTDLEVDWGALDVSDVYPQRIPDVSAGHPVVLSGRFTNALPTTIHITGRAGTRHYRHTLTVSAGDVAENHPGLVSLWARAHIAALERDNAAAGGKGSQQPNNKIADVALEYGLVSPQTGILAVDGRATRSGEESVPIEQPVPGR